MEIIDLAKTITSGLHAHIATSIVPIMRIGDAAGKFDPPCEGFASNLLVMSDHCGTHLDVPAHFIRGGQTVEHIPLSRLVGPAVVCDLSWVPDDQVEAEHLVEALARLARPPRSGGFILLHTHAPGEPGKGLGRSAAMELLKLGVSLVGTDHTGIDNTRNRDRPGHMLLLGSNVLLVEGLVNLDRLIGREVLFVCAPLALQGGTGSPVRPFAVHPCPDGAWESP